LCTLSQRVLAGRAKFTVRSTRVPSGPRTSRGSCPGEAEGPEGEEGAGGGPLDRRR